MHGGSTFWTFFRDRWSSMRLEDRIRRAILGLSLYHFAQRLSVRRLTRRADIKYGRFAIQGGRLE